MRFAGIREWRATRRTPRFWRLPVQIAGIAVGAAGCASRSAEPEDWLTEGCGDKLTVA